MAIKTNDVEKKKEKKKKTNDVLTHASTRMKLENFTLRTRSQTQKTLNCDSMYRKYPE